jgi:hypothetical protein
LDDWHHHGYCVVEDYANNGSSVVASADLSNAANLQAFLNPIHAEEINIKDTRVVSISFNMLEYTAACEKTGYLTPFQI